jgi:hypothetical protein
MMRASILCITRLNIVHRAAALLNEDLTPPRVARQLGVPRTEGYRLRNRAREKGWL